MKHHYREGHQILPGAEQQGNGSTSSTTTNKTVRIDDKPQVEGSGENATSTPAASTNELKEVLADVGKMLKAMTAVTTIKRAEVKDDSLWARIRALSTKLGCDEEEEKTLADGLKGLDGKTVQRKRRRG